MKVIIYDKETFVFKDALDVSSDYQIILDIVLNQNSYFVTNHSSSLASVGDIIILHERSFFYIGSITNIELTDLGQVKITSVDYLTSLDFEIGIEGFSGNIGNELIRYINDEFISNEDNHQNRPFLRLVNDLDVVGKISENKDKLTKFSDFARDIYKEFKVRLQARLGIVDGVITHIKIMTVSNNKEFVLSSNFPMIRGLNISDKKEVRVNKVTFIPSKENVIHTFKESFYLLDNQSISNEKDDVNRITPVVEKKKLYKDNDLKGNIYTHKFQSGQIKTAAGTITLGNVSWYQSAATYIGFDNTANERGVQIGSSGNPNTSYFYLETPISSFGNNIKVTQVKVTLATSSILNEYKLSFGQITTAFRKIDSTSNKAYSTTRQNETSGFINIGLKATSGAMYISKIEISYQPIDSDAVTLLDIATKELLTEDYMHNINFSITRDNQVFIPLHNIQLGDKVLFIHGEKRWATILSRIEMNGTTKDFLITLGEQRIKLTEKLKLILEGK